MHPRLSTTSTIESRVLRVISASGGKCSVRNLMRLMRWTDLRDAMRWCQLLIDNGAAEWRFYAPPTCQGGVPVRKIVLKGILDETPDTHSQTAHATIDRGVYAKPTRARPGTQEKIELMRRRALVGLPVFIPGDGPEAFDLD